MSGIESDSRCGHVARSFERTEHAKGTWLGDLAVAFPDGLDLPLAGAAFEATFHSGFRVVHEGL